jgi:putative phage-type endonuclease
MEEVKKLENGHCEVVVDVRELAHDEWLKLRREGIGGSDAGAVMGLSRWSTPLAVYADKLELVPPTEETEAMNWGHIMEPVIRNEVAIRYMAQFSEEVHVYESPFVYRSKQCPYMMANIDGLIQIETLGGLEIKNLSVYGRNEWGTDEVPDYIYCQAQHYMAVTGLPFWLIAALLGNELILRRVPRNEEFIMDLIAKESEFMRRIEQREPPTSISGDEDLLRLLYPGTDEEVLNLDDYAMKVGHYLSLKANIDELEKEKKKVELLLKDAMGDHASAISGDWEIKWNRFSMKRFDSKSFQKDHPKLYEEYRKESNTQRFSIKERKGDS